MPCFLGFSAFTLHFQTLCITVRSLPTDVLFQSIQFLCGEFTLHLALTVRGI